MREEASPAAAAPVCCCLFFVSWQVVCPPASGCERPHPVRPTADTIVLTHAPAIPQAMVEAAIAFWEGCPNYGLDFPRFLRANEGERHGSSRVVEIQLGGRNSGSGTCAFFEGQRIVLYSEALSELGTPLGCSGPAANLAHELGHVLGLRHPDGHARRDRIMGPVPKLEKSARWVLDRECAAAGAAWLTSSEVAGISPLDSRRSIRSAGSNRPM